MLDKKNIIIKAPNKLDSEKRKSKIKTVLIHTDYKFVRGSKRFESDSFENTIVIFKKQEPYNGPYKKAAHFYDKDEINQVIELCKEADLVVLYDLDLLKSKIALALPDDIKIAWRFFGYELYGRMKRAVLSDKTYSCIADPKEAIKDMFRPLYHKIKYGKSLERVFYDAIERIDYMFVLSKKEYEFLSKYFNNLPEYIQCLSLSKDSISNGSLNTRYESNSKSRKIVLGNNRSAYNNHLDVLEKIEAAESKREYHFFLLFNYGREDDYANAVRNAVKGKFHYNLLEEFIPAEEFRDFYADVSALIINGYRQMAMGNIFMALNSGVKVYMNRKNTMMDWLLNNGIAIFPVAGLVADMDNNQVKLDEETITNNLKGLHNLYSGYTEMDFREIIYCKMSE